jgi:hypothetical protein
MKFKSYGLPRGCVGSMIIQPGETIKDLLVFENPITAPMGPGIMAPPARDYELDLVHKVRRYDFLIPGGMIRRLAPPAAPVGLVQATPPPVKAAALASPPPPPKKEPTLEELVAEDYKMMWSPLVRAARGKSSKAAREFLRLKKQEVLTKLAEKYELPRAKIRVLLHESEPD